MNNILSIILLLISISSYAQTLYLPSGLSGISSSNNSNVGIGRSDPPSYFSLWSPNTSIASFQYSGNTVPANNYPTINAVYDAGGYMALRTNGSQTAVNLALGTYHFPNLMMISDGGNVGIGTISPTGKLHVFSVGGFNYGIVVESNSAANYSSTDYKNNSGDWLQTGISGSSFTNGMFGSRQGFLSTGAPNGILIGAYDTNGYLSFGTGGSALGNERMRITSSGNVGIGTTDPLCRVTSSGTESGTQITTKPIGKFINTGNEFSKLVIGSDNTNFDGVFSLDNNPTLANTKLRIYIGNGMMATQGHNNDQIVLNGNGYVGIGTASPDAKLAVSGQVHAQEVKVSVTVPGPDYVFEEDYKLSSLEEIKNYIDQNKHLPEIPSAKEMEKNGVQLGEMNMILLKKIEELTLYMIDQNKRDQIQKRQIENLLVEVEKLKSGK